MTDWSQVLETHGRIVWQTVYRLVNDDAEAADCFQETFVAAFEYSRRHPIRNWPGLLKRLATARAIDRLRKRGRGSCAPIDGHSPEMVDGARSPLALATDHEISARVRSELAALPPAQAEVCCLRFLEEWTYEEIAVELNMTVNHVGVLLNRARASLRDRLAEFAPIAAGHDVPEKRS